MMIPNVAVLNCNSKRSLTLAQQSLPVIVKKINSLLRSGTLSTKSHSDINKIEESKCDVIKDIIYQHSKHHIWIKEWACQHLRSLFYPFRYYGTISRKNVSDLHNRRLSRVNRLAFLNHSPHKNQMNGEVQCRAYTTRSVNETLIEWTKKLEVAAVPEARLSAEYIIAHILTVPRKDLSILGGSQISEDVLAETERLMTCRLARMPLQYIIGDWDFHSVTIKVRPPVFIPRPETEQLVDLALECLQGILAPKVLDIGCGSGAISLALLKNISDLKCVAVDHSRHAVELTEENAVFLGVRQRLMVIQEKVTMDKTLNLPFDKFDLIISNPPYVLRKDLMELQPEIMIYEDMRALDGGKEGLDIIKPILLNFQHLLPVDRYMLLEVDPCHQYLVPEWLKNQHDVKIKVADVVKDFNGKARFLKLIRIS